MFVCPDVKQALIQWQERIDFAHKLLTLLNSYSPPELRNACLGKTQSPCGGPPGGPPGGPCCVVLNALLLLLQTC